VCESNNFSEEHYSQRLYRHLICHNLYMCGRYRLSRRKEILDQYFETQSGDEQWQPRYNIAPTQLVPIVRQNERNSPREMCVVKWGLVPFWATDPSVGPSMI